MYYLRLLEYYQSQKRFHSVILSRSRGHHRIQRRKLGLGRSNNNPHFLLPLQTLHSQKLARPTFSLDGSDGLSLDGARRRAAAHGSSEQALLLLPFARLITTVPLVAGRSDFTVAAPDEVAQLLLSCKRGVKWLCGTPLGNCTCGSRLMELLQISLRISFGASMCRACKSHAESELFSHGPSSHAVSVPL